ncbi:hypothetical protein [Amphritea sp. HPY]|uniref:hypothetical protein n=1 Tax=Amphritea sp. HPY TaxID=3421652 RepID=UPI003D7C4D40
MLTLFDWLVLLSVVGVIFVWLWRHLRKVFFSQCQSSGCANCNGCSRGGKAE